MILLPAIDIRGGKCVRLKQGDYAQETVYFEDPVDVAKTFEAEGATWLHLVDLDGAKAGAPEHLAILESIRRATRLSVEWGGGIRSLQHAELALSAGATRVIVGSALVKNPDNAAEMLTALGDKVVAGVDAKDGHVAVQGWTESSEVDAIDLLLELKLKGLRTAVVTDIATDGMLTGPNLDLLNRAVATGVGIIQSGGISSLADLLASRDSGAEGAIVGKAIYEGKFTVAEALACLI